MIASVEFRGRAMRALAAAEARGLSGLLVWGGGGGTVDSHSQLLYLSGFYPSFPRILDLEGVWRDRGHGAMLLTPEGSLLIADEPVAPGEDAIVDQAIETRDPIADLAVALRECGLDRAELGLVGARALSVDQYERLGQACPGLTLVPADDLLLELRMIKSEAEQALLRSGARLVVGAVERAMENAVPGARESDLAAVAAAEVFVAGGQVANAFGAASTTEPTAPGTTPVRLPPFSKRPLAEGDIYNLDLSGVLDDYFFDVCRSRVIGATDGPQERLAALARETVDSVIGAIRPGVTAGQAAEAGFEVLRQAGYSTEGDEFEALGHGLGLGFEPPYIHPSVDTPLAPGMVLAVEKVCVEDRYAAGFERTFLVTEDGTEVLGR